MLELFWGSLFGITILIAYIEFVISINSRDRKEDKKDKTE